MLSERTPEQIEADAEMMRAVDRVAQAYWGDDHSMVMDFIVLVQREDPTAPGESQYNYVLPNGSLPWHRMLGLMTVFDSLMRRDVQQSHGQADD